MSVELATQAVSLLERVVIGGDLSKLAPADRLQYYKAVCQSCGLNPLTRPFDYLNLSGRLVLYAKKDATDQLRSIHGVSIVSLTAALYEGVYVVTATARDKTGREDTATGAVWVDGIKGEAKANAMMKAETKAKRRVTLSICGLGMLDETEIESVVGSQPVKIDMETGEIEASGDNPHPTLADLNAGDRSKLVDQINQLHDQRATPTARRTLLWARIVGPNVSEQDAPIDKLLALRDQLAKEVG